MERIKIFNNKWNYVKDDGTYLLDEHVLYCYDFKEGFAVITYNDNTYNLINSESKRLLKNNFENCYSSNRGFVKVEINGIWYYIDKECNFYNLCKVSFKKLYNKYPNMRSELIEIIDKYTYHNVEEYFNI